MPRSRIDFDTVRSIGLSLPEVEESITYGSPALKVRGKLLTCIPIHRSAEPDSLMVCIDFPTRDALLSKQPDTYYMAHHYRSYATILVRLAQVGPHELRKLLEEAAQFVGAQKAKKTSIAGHVFGNETVSAIAASLGIGRSDIVDAAWADNGPGWVAVLLRDAEAVLAVRPGAVPLDVGLVGFYPPGSPEAMTLPLERIITWLVACGSSSM